MNYCCTIASTWRAAVDPDPRMSFDQSTLVKMQQEIAKYHVVRHNFANNTAFGVVRSSCIKEFKSGSYCIEALVESFTPVDSDVFVVPGIVILGDGRYSHLFALGTTTDPVDKSLLPLRPTSVRP